METELTNIVKVSKSNYEALLDGSTVKGHTYDASALYLVQSEGGGGSSASSLKKVSVHKAIPVRTQFEGTAVFGGRAGNLYFKPAGAKFIFKRLTSDDVDMLNSYSGEYFDYSQVSGSGTYAIYFNGYLDDGDKGNSSNAYIFEAKDGVTFEQFLTDPSIRNSMLTDVTEADSIAAKPGFEIHKGKVVCVKEPDLFIARACDENHAKLFISDCSVDGVHKCLWRRISNGEGNYYISQETAYHKIDSEDYEDKCAGNCKIVTKYYTGKEIDGVYLKNTKYCRRRGSLYRYCTGAPTIYRAKARKGKYLSAKSFKFRGKFSQSINKFLYLEEI